MTRTKIAALLVLALLTTTAAEAIAAQEPGQAPAPVDAVAINVTGDWVVTMEMGDANLTLKQEEAKITGVIESPQGTLDVEGEIEGSELVFWAFVEDFAINFYATIEENKKMAGTLEAAGGEFVVDFTAVRKEQR